MGGEQLVAFVEHEELLALASASELKRLFQLAASSRLSGLPIKQHTEPFLQVASDTIPL